MSRTPSVSGRCRGAIPWISILVMTFALLGCRGPDKPRTPPKLPLDVVAMSLQVPDGVRKDALEEEWRARGRTFARKIFDRQPMPKHMPVRHGSAARASQEILQRVAQGARMAKRAEPPGWTRGVERPAEAMAYDLPRNFQIVVRRGESLDLLSRWSRQEARSIRRNNRDVLRRRGTRPGDHISLIMSPNQKLAFDQAREEFQHKRIDKYFSRRYISRVVRYVVKRGDVISRVANRYGKTPTWLLMEFNQRDFRSLQPGETVLIPVVRDLSRNRRRPPPLQVVDEKGQPLIGAERQLVERDLSRGKLVKQARMAVDDSSVFERAIDELAAARPPAGILPGDVTWGQSTVARSPTYASPLPEAPAPLPDLPAVQSEPEDIVEDRVVVIRPGETVGHLMAWSGATHDNIVGANPGLNPNHVQVGQRLSLPLTDDDFSRFVLARAESRAKKQRHPHRHVPGPPERMLAGGKRPVLASIRKAVGPSFTHEVQPGEIASRIARMNNVSLKALVKANPGKNLDRLRPGDVLKIPAGNR